MDKILFFTSNQIKLHAGGPAGYLANLKRGFELIGEKLPIFEEKKKKGMANLLVSLIPHKKLRKSLRKILTSIIYGEASALVGILSRNARLRLKHKELKWVICNSVPDFILVYRFLKENNPNVKIALMSHTPETWADEISGSFLGEVTKMTESWLIRLAKKLEQEAFEHSDLLIFPTRESMEPCLQKHSWFKQIANSKPIYFIPTGCNDLKRKKIRPKKEILKQYHLSKDDNVFRICYVGRHNEVKGYDILKSVAQRVSKATNIEFVIGGGGEIQPLEEPFWKECGRVDPAEIFSISDVFVLPNRSTYFDLICLEACSFGIPIIASATGGNISMNNVTNQIKLFKISDKPEENLAETLLELSQKTKEDLRRIGTELRQSFETHWTLKCFAHNYVQFLKELKDQQKGIAFGKKHEEH